MANGEFMLKCIKWFAGVITSVAIIGGAVTFAADIRYAQKSEVGVQIRYATDQLRKTTLEDKIYELTLIKEAERTDAQRALLDRFIRQLNELNARWTNPPLRG